MPDFPQIPYPIVGILQEATSGISVIGINLRTNNIENVTTEEDGSFIIDPANITDGYNDGDIIRISSGSWYINTSIDLLNNPEGKTIKLNKPITKTITRSRGVNISRGISCGKYKRRT